MQLLDLHARWVLESFEKLTEVCPYKESSSPDCKHPDQDFNCMLCCPANCPLLLVNLGEN